METKSPKKSIKTCPFHTVPHFNSIAMFMVLFGFVKVFTQSLLSCLNFLDMFDTFVSMDIQ